MLRACNSHFLEVQDSFIMSRVWSCEPTRIGLGILHAAFFAWICESSIFRLSTKLQCGSLSFLAISTKIWWVQFRVVKCILLAVNLSPRGVTTWSCAWARRVLRIFPSRSDWIDIASLTLRRAVEIISYGLMVQVEFLNSFLIGCRYTCLFLLRPILFMYHADVEQNNIATWWIFRASPWMSWRKRSIWAYHLTQRDTKTGSFLRCPGWSQRNPK